MDNRNAMGSTQQWNFNRFCLFVKRQLKLNRFLLVIDTKKGVVISAITLIILDLIDLLWNLSMTFGPLGYTMTTLLLMETFFVICVCSSLLYTIKTDNKADLRSILFTWLVVVAIDYCLRATLNFSALIISEKASTTARVMKSVESIVMIVLVAHCWLCVFTYYDDNNGKITTVKITPSDDKGRLQFNKRQMIMMKPPPAQAELSAASLEREVIGDVGGNMLRAPTEDVAKSRCKQPDKDTQAMKVVLNSVSLINIISEFRTLIVSKSDRVYRKWLASTSGQMTSNKQEVNQMVDWFNYIAFDLWHEIGDPAAEKYFWLKGPWLTWLATIAYLYIVMKAGPNFMRNRKPYDLKLAIRLYNLLLVVINTYLFIGTVHSFRYGLDFWGCGEPISTRKRELMLYYGHQFFHTRYLEFFDTFFFVLRKKNSQISFLHVFHHAIVPTLMYIGLKFFPLPFNSLLPSTNMFVHIIMYAYYGLATFGPEVQRYLWWKKYLTTMQISQFMLLIIHCAHAFILDGPGCKYPLTMVWINFCIGVTFLTLFVSFYRQTYRTGQLSAKQTQAAKTMNGFRSPDGMKQGRKDAPSSMSEQDMLIKQKYS